jgi:hypothetical protein
MATVTDLTTTNYIENLSTVDKDVYNSMIEASSLNITKNKRQYERNKTFINKRKAILDNIIDKYDTVLTEEETIDNYYVFKQGVTYRRDALARADYVEKINSYISILMDKNIYKTKNYERESKELSYKFGNYTKIVNSLETAEQDFTDFTAALG